MKVALVHDWLVSLGGGERVLQEISALFPAPIYALFADCARLPFFRDREVYTSFLQKMPGIKRRYRAYLPLFPIAVEQFDLTRYDLVISSSHSVAKGVLTRADQCHICYCHTPMRYAWDLYWESLRGYGLKSGIKGTSVKLLLHYLRLWDATSAHRVDAYIANSAYVAGRIRKTYAREAAVIYPPIDVEFFFKVEEKGEFYLTASRLVAQKRVDLIVEAFASLPSKRLVVIGEGPEMDAIAKKAGKNVELLGYQSDRALRGYLQRAKAFLFAALEDFGMILVEAQACGTPVIAFGRGGALETVIEGETGLFFREQKVESLLSALSAFEREEGRFVPSAIRLHAEGFSRARFQREFRAFVEERLRAFGGGDESYRVGRGKGYASMAPFSKRGS